MAHNRGIPEIREVPADRYAASTIGLGCRGASPENLHEISGEVRRLVCRLGLQVAARTPGDAAEWYGAPREGGGARGSSAPGRERATE